MHQKQKETILQRISSFRATKTTNKSVETMNKRRKSVRTPIRWAVDAVLEDGELVLDRVWLEVVLLRSSSSSPGHFLPQRAQFRRQTQAAVDVDLGTSEKECLLVEGGGNISPGNLVPTSNLLLFDPFALLFFKFLLLFIFVLGRE